MIKSLCKIYESSKEKSFFIPKIFIRVRQSEQIERLMSELGDSQKLITGFIIPKFIPDTADEYINKILAINEKYNRTIYMMPILESPSMIDIRNRYDILYAIKDKLKRIEPLVLNIRVGGNDLCKLFGFRRHCDESIHDIKPVSSIFSDIVTVFGLDYVISGPVWEYFHGYNWEEGMENEIEVVNKAYKVNKKDIEDAHSILNWSMNSASLVAGSQGNERMNEYKTHCIWAEKVKLLADVYGINY